MKKTKQLDEPKTGLMTEPMDTSSEDFKKFQAIILNKIKAQSKEDILNIELFALKIKMEDYLSSEDSAIQTAGAFLKSFLNVLNISQKRFATYIGMEPTLLSKMINGDRPINSEYALIISKIFGTDPILWLEVQAKNELKELNLRMHSSLQKYSLNDLLQENTIE
jgi:addiction module HigA family antidote